MKYGRYTEVLRGEKQHNQRSGHRSSGAVDSRNLDYVDGYCCPRAMPVVHIAQVGAPQNWGVPLSRRQQSGYGHAIENRRYHVPVPSHKQAGADVYVQP